jgi:tRNA-dihydrouridine synthase
MVGRATGGKPWLIAQIAAALAGGPAPVVPAGAALVDMVARHYEASLSFYGADLGMRVIRKHLGWYMDATGTPAGLRREVLAGRDPKAVLASLADALSERAEAA